MHAFSLGLVTHMHGPVGRDQDGGDVPVETPPQFTNDTDAVGAVEMIVDEKTVRLDTVRAHRIQRFGQIGRRQHAAAPAAEQLPHPVKDRAVVVDAKRNRAGQAPRPRPGNSLERRLGSRRLAARHFHRKA